MTVDEVAAEVTYELRGAVLRPNGGEITWAGDEDPATFHLAARTADGARRRRRPLLPRALPVAAAGHARPGSCAAWPPTRPCAAAAPAGPWSTTAWQRVADRGGDLVWCDARTTAAGFYERMGFTVVTDEFDKPGIGPHVGMVIEVRPAGGPRSG